jgi:ubiquitin carboxyl-terminal hydrolase 9/13
MQTPDPFVPTTPDPVPTSSAAQPPLSPAAQPQPVPKRRGTYRSGGVPASLTSTTSPGSSTSNGDSSTGETYPIAGSIPIPTSPPTLFSALRSLFVHIATHPADKGTVAPRAFVDKLKAVNEQFRSTQQQDAHEFFNYALNLVADEVRRNRRERRADCG